MAFATPAFLSVFFPAGFFLCFLTRGNLRAQNLCLAALSLVFFAWAKPALGVLPVALTALEWFLGKGIAGAKTKSLQRLCAWLAVGVPLLGLVVCKYLGFFAEVLNGLFSLDLASPRLVQPLGVSFFTFKAVSYALDVRSQKEKPAERFDDLFLYLCLFPQMTAGPISQWREMRPQLVDRRMTLEGVRAGCVRFALGLSKKVLLADVLAGVVKAAFGCPAEARSAALAWLGAVAFTLQIYLDFSGYSDMAIGLGRMLGFTFPENFSLPLRAKGMRDFWRRWHMSLTAWFREYVYLPLGGNRKGLFCTCRNLGIVFLCTGLWHGANWTFVVWGLWNGLLLVLERTRLLAVPGWRGLWAHGYTLLAVTLGFVVFRSESIPPAFEYVRSMVTTFGMSWEMKGYLLEQLTPMNLTALGVSIAVAVSPGAKARARLGQEPWAQAALCAVCCALVALSYAAILASGFKPFLYAQF